MIVAADWVLPMAGPPIRDGAVHVVGDRIHGVGALAGLTTAAPGEPVEHFEGCVIIPGLVDAHTHLSLSVLAGLVPRMPMRSFLRHVFAALTVLTDEDYAVSAALGALELLRGGVTCVGDIAYGPQPLQACRDAGVGGAFFWEVLGIEEESLPDELARRRFPANDRAADGRTRCGLSPHTPYTSGPRLLRAVHALARERGVGFAIHVAESESERELMLHGTGPLAGPASRLALGFVAPGVGSVEYLDDLGVLEDAIAVHCVRLEPSDPVKLALCARGVVVCPRSNDYLGNGAPPIADLRAAGVRVGIGTDSPASNDDLDLFAEARAMREVDESLTAENLLAMMTIDGARLLRLDDELGTLEAAKSADLAIVRIGGGEPFDAVVSEGGPSAIRAVMSAGVWRVLDGTSAASVSVIRERAQRARDKAAAAIAAEAGRTPDPG